MLTGALGCCLAHETLLSQAGTDTSSPDFTMDMTEMNHPGSESETELTIKLEDPEELPLESVSCLESKTTEILQNHNPRKKFVDFFTLIASFRTRES